MMTRAEAFADVMEAHTELLSLIRRKEMARKLGCGSTYERLREDVVTAFDDYCTAKAILAAIGPDE